MFNVLRYRVYRTILKKGRRRRLLAAAEARFEQRFGLKIPRDPDMFPPDFLDLENLMDQILELRPKRVLELGGGYSTFVLANALDRVWQQTGEQFEFITVDQSLEYLEKTRALFPADLAEKVTFTQDEIYTDTRDGVLMSFFKNLPDGEFDFTYEDRCDHQDTAIAGDLFVLEERAIKAGRRFSFTIDLMIATAQACKKGLKRNYVVTGEYRTGTNFTQFEP